MKLIGATVMAALLITTGTGAFAEEDKGPMERVGSALDKGVEATRDYLSDAAVTSRVKKKYVRDEYVSAFDINVTTYNGRVILEGDVSSEAIAQRAVDMAKATKGVRSVENRLYIITRLPSKAK